MKKWQKVIVWVNKNYDPKIKKTKTRWTKVNNEILKSTIFEMISYWFTLQEIADKTWYWIQHIANISAKIDDEFMIDLWKEREYQIRKHIKKLEWITKKLYKSLYETDVVKEICSLQDQILKTVQFMAKLQWLLIDINQISLKEDVTWDLLKGYWVFSEEE